MEMLCLHTQLCSVLPAGMWAAGDTTTAALAGLCEMGCCCCLLRTAGESAASAITAAESAAVASRAGPPSRAGPCGGDGGGTKNRGGEDGWCQSQGAAAREETA